MCVPISRIPWGYRPPGLHLSPGRKRPTRPGELRLPIRRHVLQEVVQERRPIPPGSAVPGGRGGSGETSQEAREEKHTLLVLLTVQEADQREQGESVLSVVSVFCSLSPPAACKPLMCPPTAAGGVGHVQQRHAAGGEAAAGGVQLLCPDRRLWSSWTTQEGLQALQ